jgi:hypothetical protein
MNGSGGTYEENIGEKTKRFFSINWNPVSVLYLFKNVSFQQHPK